jgi:serine protease Do
MRYPIPVLSCVVSLFSVSSLALAQDVKPAMQTRADFRQIVQDGKSKVFPAVVYIKVVREDNQMGEKKSQEISGSGVIISPEGEVLTNWHVVDKAENVRCLLTDGRGVSAKVLGSDKDTDLALIKLDPMPDGPTPPYAAFGDSRVLKEGDFVMAMGAPWGLNRSVSIGIVSCTNRYLEGISEYSHWIQTDAAINPGNSGGPLVNTEGQIVGINARGTSGSAEGLGFAIPSETAQIMVNQLRATGHVDWAWFGLQLQPLHDFNKDIYFEGTEGVIVAETDPDSPARSAGIQSRDRILAINGTTLKGITEEDLSGIRRQIGLLPKGQEASFLLQRGEEKLTVKIAPREKGAVEGKEVAYKRWDLTVKEINQFDNPDLYFYRNKGVFVYATKYPGNASNAGLRNGDIIVKVETSEVNSIADIEKIHTETVDKLSSKPRIVFTVMRAGLTRQVVVDMQRDYSKE